MANTGQEGEEEGEQIVAKQLEPPCKERERESFCLLATATNHNSSSLSIKFVSKGTFSMLLLIVSSKPEHSFVWLLFEFTRDHFRPETQPAKPIAAEV